MNLKSHRSIAIAREIERSDCLLKLSCAEIAMSGMKIVKGKCNILIGDCCFLSQSINNHGDLVIEMWNLQYHENLVEAFPNNWNKKQFMPSRSKIWDRINRTSNASQYWSCGKELIARNILKSCLILKSDR